MSVLRMPLASLRLERAEFSRLAWAFGLSLALHLLLFGTYQTGRKLGWWQQIHWASWLQSTKMLSSLLPKKLTSKQAEAQRRQELPLMFVDVNPAVATSEPPKNSPYYSALNSKAANPEPDKDLAIPKITGEQTDIVKTEDVPKPMNSSLQPRSATAQREEQEEEKPKPALLPGDLTVGKSEPKPNQEPGQATRTRPRTLAQALQLPENRQLAGRKMKQEGGVRRRDLVTSLDVIATPFGDYDAAIVAAVQSRWYALLEDRSWAADRTGRVTIRFHLNSDGTLSELKLVDHTVDLALAMLCQSAITDSAPFKPWTNEMRWLIGASFREVTFTFFYY